MLILLKRFQNKSRFDTEHDKTYPCMFSSMFLIKNHQQGHSLKSQKKNLRRSLEEVFKSWGEYYSSTQMLVLFTTLSNVFRKLFLAINR